MQQPAILFDKKRLVFSTPAPASLSKAQNAIIILCFLTGMSCKLMAQDTIPAVRTTLQDSAVVYKNSDYRLDSKRLIIPAVCIAYGVASLNIKALRQLNFSTRDEVLEDSPARTQWNNFTQYLPAVIVYGFNAAGIKGKHNFGDMTIIYATSQLLSASMVLPLKSLVRERRPDNSDYMSFPSGHTAVAFSSAQFMFREYKDSDWWLSLCGYPIAIFTGIYRVTNNKHYVGDVVAGAGFGILSTELAYWLYPKIHALLDRGKRRTQTMIVPAYQQGSYNVALIRTF